MEESEHLGHLAQGLCSQGIVFKPLAFLDANETHKPLLVLQRIDLPILKKDALIDPGESGFVEIERMGDAGRIPLPRKRVPIPINNVGSTHRYSDMAFVALRFGVVSIGDNLTDSAYV
ncbi:hypothetical protein H8B02_22930 [Bradyrhizobium sp. Pear77]|uniref:hypothetical protein n=1 Tax=Bradyrhizobium altum TaxID=1571202 RepID=UPI001E29D0EC|nr:hypothetical protein [Bradyrhizobium altum]MCC8956177.1 hypothetical protein [Bradyrhizobium altum]